MKPKPTYDSRSVPAHDSNVGASVLLMNEAPGPSEAESGIPSFGQQGGSIFHALRRAGISWAVAHKKFVWPRNGDAEQSERHRQKAAFLESRARHITCTNAFPRWPKPSPTSGSFCPPCEADVISPQNIERIRSEVHPAHRAILVCGNFAYLACIGRTLPDPASREGTEMTAVEMHELNERLASCFERGWYMGHTRRWSIRPNETASSLRLVSQFVGWPMGENAG